MSVLTSPARSISVVIPALNEAREIETTLERVGSGHEVVVVDGGSHDDTVGRARALGARVLDSPAGRARQMNRGAAATRGEILLFLHADTHLPKDWNAALLEAVAAGAVGGRFDVTLRGHQPMLRVVATMMNLRSRLTRVYTGDQAIFVCRGVFEGMGGYPSIPLMEDLALSRLLKREGPVACLRARVSTSGRRWESHGVLRTIVLMWAIRLAYFLGVSPETLARFYR